VTVSTYKYKEEKVKLDGRVFKAVFPEKHSRVKGLIFEFIDSNYHDSFGGRPNWVRQMYVMWKGTNKWQWIMDADPDYTWAGCGMGIFTVLCNLEDQKLLTKWNVEARITEITREMSRYEKMLKQAKEELKNLKRKA